MPPPNLHMTAIEVTHSKTAPEISSVVAKLRPRAEEIVNYTFTHRARLVKPSLGFDDQAIALSFAPATGDAQSAADDGSGVTGDEYSYHHLRRDLWGLVQDAGVEVGSRYVVPSAHLTIGRFITNEDFFTDGNIEPGKVRHLVDAIDQVNRWLEMEYWPDRDGGIREGGEWVVGQEFGLDCRMGTL